MHWVEIVVSISGITRNVKAPATAGDPAPCPGTASDLPRTQTPAPQVEPAFTWMTDIPDRLRRRLHWTPVPLQCEAKPTILLLYAGKDDAGSLDSFTPHAQTSPH